MLLEAAASGVAVVATDVGGTREIFPPEADAARLVPPDDPARFVTVLDLLGNRELLRRLGAAARRLAEERFDIRKNVVGLVEHYRTLSL